MPKPMITGVSTASSAGVVELPQRRRGADVDDRAVVGPLRALHDLAVGELAPHLLHDGAGGAADGADGERAEQERDRAADQQTDERLRVGDVDLGLGVRGTARSPVSVERRARRRSSR